MSVREDKLLITRALPYLVVVDTVHGKITGTLGDENMALD